MPSPFLQTRAPLLWLLLPLMAGISVAKTVSAPPFALAILLVLALAAACGALAAARKDRPVECHALLVLAAGLAGFVLPGLRHPHLHDRTERPPREITLTLHLTELYRSDASARTQGGLGRVIAAGFGEPELPGQLIYFSAIRRVSAAARPAATVKIQGVLEPLPTDAGAGFEDYLANLGVRHRLVRARILEETAPPGRLAAFYTAARARLQRILAHGLERHPGTASLYRAMLLGEKTALSTEQENAFLRSGTFHVFSVSGLHVGVIALTLRLFGKAVRLPGRIGAALTLVVLWVYVQVTGAGAPSVRAFVMVAFLLASEVFRLPGNALSALTASALVLLLIEPLQLFHTGFQMSYAVVSALILLGAPLAERWLAPWQPFVFVPRPQWRWWHEAIAWSGRKVIASAAGCWAAFLASAAAGIGFFGVFSPGSLLANLIILPLTSLAIVAGFLSLLTGLAGLLPWSALFNAAAALIIVASEWLLVRGTELPGAYFPAAFRAGWLTPAGLAGMTALLLAGASVRWQPRYGGFWPPVVFIALLLLFGVNYG